MSLLSIFNAQWFVTTIITAMVGGFGSYFGARLATHTEKKFNGERKNEKKAVS